MSPPGHWLKRRCILLAQAVPFARTCESQKHMKRQHDLEDAGDRAQKQRKPGMVRMPLNKIGFWPPNRGGMGVSTYHVHEVAWDCMAHKTKIQRYDHVDIVKIPSDALQEMRHANSERCESDSMMPLFSPEMQYVCAGKTHFVHAQKLAQSSIKSMS